MKIKALSMSLAGLCLFAATAFSGPSHASDKAPDGGDFKLAFNSPAKPNQNEVAEALKQNADLPELIAEINRVLSLPNDIPVVFESCGQANAFYIPDSRSISMCYELVQAFAEHFEGSGLDQASSAEAILGSTAFIMLHEIGHALVHNLDIPITGREEDAVDDLAALVALQFDSEGQDAVFSIVESFAALAEADFERGGIAFHGEHSLSAQRMYNIMCILYGSNPEHFRAMVSDDVLPESRAVRCPAEYQQKSRSWERLLGRHLKG